ncbi:MAG TPA: hypothetical protein VM753_17835 [Anaeromyxobacter sp.]|nr:hypothetical protein [Anaeromyxobacter sp.]
MRHALLVAIAAASLLAGCSDPALFAQLEVPTVRVTLPSQSFPASSAVAQYPCAPPPAQQDCVATDLTYDLSTQLPIVSKPNVSYELRLTSVSIALRTNGSGTDLGGVKAVAIRIDPQATGGGIVVASYARSAADPHPTSIAVAGDSSVDLASYVRSGQLPVRVEMTFDAPTPAFTADVTSTYELQAKVDWGAYL